MIQFLQILKVNYVTNNYSLILRKLTAKIVNHYQHYYYYYWMLLYYVQETRAAKLWSESQSLMSDMAVSFESLRSMCSDRQQV